jgi:lysozyme family protein
MVDLLKAERGFPGHLDGHAELQERIKTFHQVNYWDKVCGDEITNQDMAESIFDFSVNAGPIASMKLAQTKVGVKADGVIGPATLGKINADEPRAFLALLALHKIARYLSICEKRSESRKYFYGWVKRTLEGHLGRGTQGS